ncbi:MAG: hypothetical protein WC371_04900 [Parachlamydiales bacterium]|jgi:hypothetical protein
MSLPINFQAFRPLYSDFTSAESPPLDSSFQLTPKLSGSSIRQCGFLLPTTAKRACRQQLAAGKKTGGNFRHRTIKTLSVGLSAVFSSFFLGYIFSLPLVWPLFFSSLALLATVKAAYSWILLPFWTAQKETAKQKFMQAQKPPFSSPRAGL